MLKPNLTFFCELDSRELRKLFDDRGVIDDLITLDASLSLGIRDLTDSRADVVKRLNFAGIPVIAWLLLPEEEGYWFNLHNYDKAAARYAAFSDWTVQHGLEWSGIGLDIEMDINELRQLLEQKQAIKLVSTFIQRYFDKQSVQQAQQAYQGLINQIRADGYPVESYQIPLIVDERRARSTVLQRTVGLVDLKTDREVLMLYSSFLRPDGAAALWHYAPQADSVGVGNTGGGVDIEGVIDLDPLDWQEFSRDLRLCAMREKPIHIFCLEGCVNQGFLSKLITFDWDKPNEIPVSAHPIGAIRKAMTVGLWLLTRPWMILAGLAVLIGLGFLFKRRKDS